MKPLHPLPIGTLRRWRKYNSPALRIDHRGAASPLPEDPLTCKLHTICILNHWNLRENVHGARYYIPELRLGIVLDRFTVSPKFTDRPQCHVQMTVGAILAQKHPNRVIDALSKHFGFNFTPVKSD